MENPVSFGRVFLLGGMMESEPEHLFIGFRKESREKYAKLLGVEPKAVQISKLKISNYNAKDHLYLSSFRLLNWTIDNLRTYIKSCETKKLRFVCLKEEFCFDGTISKRKQIRPSSIMLCKVPEIGFGFLNLAKAASIPSKAEWKSAPDWFGYPKDIIDDFLATSLTDKNKRLLTIKDIAFRHNISVATVRKILLTAAYQVDEKLKEDLERAKKRKKTKSLLERLEKAKKPLPKHPLLDRGLE